MKNDKNISEPVALITKRLIPYLTNEELDQLAYRVKMEALSREIYGQGSKLDLSSNPLCPVNADHTVIKYGKNGEKQRYYCKECQTTFVNGSKSMLANSQLDMVTWRMLINGMLIWSATLEQLSNICGISETTAFYCRLRVFYALELLNKRITLSKNIEVDETYVSYNVKGQDPEDLSRPARKRGGINTMKNHNKNLICIVVAVEKENQVENKFRISSKIAGFGLPSQDRIYSVLKNKIVPDDNTTLITDGAKAYGLLAKQLSLNWKRLVTQTKGRKRVPKIEGIYNVQTVNAFHRKLKDFLRNTHGVSSKYLQGFLELFDFRVNYSELSSDDQELLILKTLLNCEFHLTNEELASRYCIPTYVGQIAAEWKKKFSRNEIRIYKEIKRGHPLDDIVNKYQVSRQQIRRLVNQIERLNMDAEILRQNTKKEPAPKREYTEKQWEIYTLYKTGKYTHKELAKQYGCTRQNIGKIIKKIDKTSSAYDRAERQSLSKLTLRSRRAAEKRKRTANNHKKIYDQFNVLCGGNSRISLTQAYSTIGKWNNMSKNTIRNIVFRYRKSDPNAVWRKKGTRIAIDVKHKISSPVMSENP